MAEGVEPGSIDEFLSEMYRFVPEDARIMACQFRGDPNSDIYGKWKARVVTEAWQIDEGANVYLCVSAMRKNSRGEFRRRKENFAGGVCLMIDDLGDGIGAKFPLSTIDELAPTALIETSPNNYQAVYFFDSLITDMEKFDGLIRAFIERKFLGVDTGQAGVNRVFRPPFGVNGKPKYGGWKVRMESWKPRLRYSIEQIAEGFHLNIVSARRINRDSNIIESLKPDRIRGFIAVRRLLRAAGMIKREEEDYSGWIQISCPWLELHSDRADTGAAIRLPREENEWFGAFRCHHGHCEGKGWRELTDWITSEGTTNNENAGEFGDYKL